ncbi:MAG: hypothetical protein WDO12_06145 [Pseudomonadota bacterium]
MNMFRKTLLAASLAVSAMPVLSATAETPPPAQGQDVEKRLEDARKRLDADAREVAELSGQLGRNFAFQMRMPDGGAPPRALLGVNIDNNSGDAKGARVRDVSPGSAAAEAASRPATSSPASAARTSPRRTTRVACWWRRCARRSPT